MDPQELIRRLMATFLLELDEHVQALNKGLLTLEKEPPPEERAEVIQTLFRTAHSLKGAARSVNVGPIEAACHSLEDVLGLARDGELELGPGHYQLLFEVADAMDEVRGLLKDEKDLSDTDLIRLLPRIEQVAGGALTEVETMPVEAAPAAEAVEATPENPAPSSGPPPAVGDRLGGGFVRVPASKLDALLDQSGELLLARHRLAARREALVSLQEFAEDWHSEWRKVNTVVSTLSSENRRGSESSSTGWGALRRHLPLLERADDNMRRMIRDLERVTTAVRGDERFLGQALLELDGEVKKARMIPFSEACQGLDRAARDLARGAGKEVEVEILGGQVEMDRAILELLRDPLLHMVRNSIDHGIELPEERLRLTKPPAGRVTVSAELRGTSIEVAVTDDGHGLDLDAIRMKALKRKRTVPEEDAEVARLILLPGFSTAPIITELSGRGIGMDVVASTVEGLRGSIDISSEPGRGSRFVMTIPLTLTTLRGLLVRVAGRPFVLDTSTVRRLVRVSTEDIRSAEGQDVLILGRAPLKLRTMARVLGISGRDPVAVDGKLPVVVVKVGDQEAAFAVDEVIAEREVLIKSLGSRLGTVPNVSAATILADGRMALILDSAELLRTALGPTRAGIGEATFGETRQEPKKRIVVVDDSMTARSLVQTALDQAGYEVAVAVDGADAWQILQDRGADLVVSDVEMPRVDGFSLTERIRASETLKDLPVVLVSARATDQDKLRGMQVGADAYLVKSTFDQKALLTSVGQLLG